MDRYRGRAGYRVPHIYSMLNIQYSIMITMVPPEQLRLPICFSLAPCEPPSSMCSSSAQAGRDFRSATPSSSLLGPGSLQYAAHSFRSCISRASLRPLRPALLFHQYLRLPRRSRLECGKLHAHAKFKAVFAAFRTLLKFVLE